MEVIDLFAAFTTAHTGWHLITVKVIIQNRLEVLPDSVKAGLEAADAGCCDHINREAVPVGHNSLRDEG